MLLPTKLSKTVLPDLRAQTNECVMFDNEKFHRQTALLPQTNSEWDQGNSYLQTWQKLLCFIHLHRCNNSVHIQKDLIVRMFGMCFNQTNKVWITQMLSGGKVIALHSLFVNEAWQAFTILLMYKNIRFLGFLAIFPQTKNV